MRALPTPMTTAVARSFTYELKAWLTSRHADALGRGSATGAQTLSRMLAILEQIAALVDLPRVDEAPRAALIARELLADLSASTTALSSQRRETSAAHVATWRATLVAIVEHIDDQPVHDTTAADIEVVRQRMTDIQARIATDNELLVAEMALLRVLQDDCVDGDAPMTEQVERTEDAPDTTGTSQSS